jgi:hypothetical protein
MTGLITTVTRNILIVSSLMTCQLACAQSRTVEVTGGQPVEKAIEQLEAIYGVPITYEDTTTVNESQLEDVTEQVQRTPDPSHRIMRIRERTLSFTYKPLSSGSPQSGVSPETQEETAAKVADALSSVLDGYANSGGSATFSVTNEDGIFHVLATNFLNKDGKLQQLTPILDTKITIPPKERTRLGLFQEICRSLSESADVHFGEGDFPFNRGSVQAQTATTISGSDVPARTLLSQLLTELAAPISQEVSVDGPDGQRLTRNVVVWNGGPISWKLFYGPSWGYTLHIRRVILADK